VEWGPSGTVNPWPEIPAHSEFPAMRQDLVGSPNLKRGRKFYLLPDRPIGWAGLVDEKQNCRLQMSWDLKKLPYCGIWVDEGVLNQVASVAIEPASAYYDDLTQAWNQQRVASIPPNGSQSWSFAVSLSDAY
jgi:hypothetical protein